MTEMADPHRIRRRGTLPLPRPVPGCRTATARWTAGQASPGQVRELIEHQQRGPFHRGGIRARQYLGGGAAAPAPSREIRTRQPTALPMSRATHRIGAAIPPPPAPSPGDRARLPLRRADGADTTFPACAARRPRRSAIPVVATRSKSARSAHSVPVEHVCWLARRHSSYHRQRRLPSSTTRPADHQYSGQPRCSSSAAGLTSWRRRRVGLGGRNSSWRSGRPVT